MNDHNWLIEQFETHRNHIQAVAYRMLGSRSEADDAVQESWIRLIHSNTGEVENMGGWLTTIVSRVCLDMLRTRKSRREEHVMANAPEPVTGHQDGSDPEYEALMADSVGLAMLVVLEKLNPAERVAFVLHDIFALSFSEIALIIGRNEAAARQLASRARRRVQGTKSTSDSAELQRKRELVDAFLAASRNGDFEKLLTVLDPNVVLRNDPVFAPVANAPVVRGLEAVAKQAKQFADRARGGMKPVLVNGSVGVIAGHLDQPIFILAFTVVDGKITEIGMIADQARLRGLDIADLND
ncbi:sigma-70 family RNA polymerase sigma factor [Paenibacillus nasutitermitis]|uniref:DNA-directed RNA polymerase sigma-70 factor n=1 Tax=Paenibacillus nasutitermitis TaxID=1652958 RepID=A0A917DVY3_9BACL|nr:sigma-70 family RNA polymerase sigma factor [Paenibacillus nasutitermitis]GGD71997.1 DNA-directed RNA polymerase sigma-70 factor [Paenibacillus nasutitermitis]